jgi:hypothetical protein
MRIELTDDEAHMIGKVLTSGYARHLLRMDEEHYYRTVAKFTKFDADLLLALEGRHAVDVARQCGAVAERMGDDV